MVLDKRRCAEHSPAVDDERAQLHDTRAVARADDGGRAVVYRPDQPRCVPSNAVHTIGDARHHAPPHAGTHIHEQHRYVRWSTCPRHHCGAAGAGGPAVLCLAACSARDSAVLGHSSRQHWGAARCDVAPRRCSCPQAAAHAVSAARSAGSARCIRSREAYHGRGTAAADQRHSWQLWHRINRLDEEGRTRGGFYCRKCL
mmetsp:Transcript_35038/g.103781  ORF Transcript_35038/g.103781 Transcript_35038/m.103781 type:complete len:200 (+) Transcript_35038:650-1249(+)